MKMKFTPTQEQQEILTAFKEHKIMKVNAVAGSGKSSTLRLLAQENQQPSLYVCFNKQNATEAAKSILASERFVLMFSTSASSFATLASSMSPPPPPLP